LEKILFLADSPCNLYEEDIRGKPIRIVSASVVYPNGDIVPEVGVDRNEYYKLLMESSVIPTTAMGSPELWMHEFTKAYEEGFTHVIALAISSKGSSVLQTALIGWGMFQELHPNTLILEAVDSLGYSITYGRVIREALQLHEDGADFAQTVAFVKERVLRSRAIFGAYSLKCMKKSGRIGPMAAVVGEAMGIRPVLIIKDGLISPLDKVRGVKNLIPRMIELVEEDISKTLVQDIHILYGLIPDEDMKLLEQLITAKLHPKHIYYSQACLSITTNTGPEILGIGYYA
jgi:DegV family protein with EDD domain